MPHIFRDIEENGEELVLTDHNHAILPIAKVRTVAEVFGDIQGRPVYLAYIDAPTTGEWTEA